MNKTTVRFKLRASMRMPGSGVSVLRVTRRRATGTMTFPYVLSFEEWDENRQEIIFPANISSKRKKELVSIKGKLKKHLQEVHTAIGVMEARGDYSSQELLECIRKRHQGQMFCAYALNKAENLRKNERFGTAHIYQYAVTSFRKFLNGQDIRIDKLNACLIKEYGEYLLKMGKSPNTVSCYMRTLRANYNLAIREKISVGKKTKEKPFSGVFTGNAKTLKRAISGESISRLAGLELEEGRENYRELEEGKKKDRELDESRGIHSLIFSRDLFLFSFYTQGMSFTDIVNLKKENIRDGFIRYKRKKTGQQIIIEMEDCIKDIIERYYDKDSEFVFPVLRNFKDFKDSKNSKDSKDSKDINILNILNVPKSFENWKKTTTALAAYNKNLKKLAALAGIEERLTSYVSRHSWATIASQEGIPIATISKGMGHESEKTTQIYIARIDYSDVGRANRQILSRIAPLPVITRNEAIQFVGSGLFRPS